MNGKPIEIAFWGLLSSATSVLTAITRVLGHDMSVNATLVEDLSHKDTQINRTKNNLKNANPIYVPLELLSLF